MSELGVALLIAVLVVCLIGHALDLHHQRVMARIRAQRDDQETRG